MALTEGQIIDVLTILGVPVVPAALYVEPWSKNDPGLWDCLKIRTAASKTEAEQESRIAALIAQWTAIQYDTDTISAQGLDSDPARARGRLAKMLGNLLGYTPQSTQGGLRIGRG